MFSKAELESITGLIDEFCDERVPIAVRDQVVLQYRIQRHDIILFEKRRSVRDPEHWIESPVVKLRFNRKRGAWTLLYCDRHRRWHRYENLEPVPQLDELLEELDADPLALFWG
jgi:hypothetical protein